MATNDLTLFSSPEAQASIKRIRNVFYGPVKTKNGPEFRGNMQYEMSFAHNFYIGAIDQIYKNADWAVEHGDILNYAGFSFVILRSLASHHHFEEETWFPAVEKLAGKPGHLTANIDQHHEFAPHIHALEAYFYDAYADLSPPKDKLPAPAMSDATADLQRCGLDPAEPFSPQKIKAVLEDMAGPLVTHLADELDTIGPDLFEAVTVKDYHSIVVQVQKYLQTEDPSTFLVSAYSGLDPNLVKIGLPLPWFVSYILLPWVFVPKHKGFWKYSQFPENIGLTRPSECT